MINYYNLDAIAELENTRIISPYGFKYGFVRSIFKEDVYKDLIKSFPDVTKFKLTDKSDSGGGRKRFYVGLNYYSGEKWGSIYHMKELPQIWKDVIKESSSEELMNLLSDATGVNFNSLCNFGFTYGNGGCMQEPHIDGAIRPNDPSPIHASVACLMYFNEKSGGVAGTAIYDLDRETILFQVPDLRNSFFYFEQHPDSWHGFPTVPEGHDRRLVSLSYSQERRPIPVSESLFSHFFAPYRIKYFIRRAKRKFNL